MPKVQHNNDMKEVQLDSRADFTDASIDRLHPQSQQQPVPDNMEADEEQNEWPVWNLAILAADGLNFLHHPANPQDHLDLELSRSSMQFLRGEGPDISLNQALVNADSDGSSSSSDATSGMVEEQVRSTAIRTRSANILIFGRKNLPSDVFVRATTPSGVNAQQIAPSRLCLFQLLLFRMLLRMSLGWKLCLGNLCWMSLLCNCGLSFFTVNDHRLHQELQPNQDL
jgi:hypothetical protein